MLNRKRLQVVISPERMLVLALIGLAQHNNLVFREP